MGHADVQFPFFSFETLGSQTNPKNPHGSIPCTEDEPADLLLHEDEIRSVEGPDQKPLARLRQRTADAETTPSRGPGAGLVVQMREKAGLALIRPVEASALVGGLVPGRDYGYRRLGIPGGPFVLRRPHAQRTRSVFHR